MNKSIAHIAYVARILTVISVGVWLMGCAEDPESGETETLSLAAAMSGSLDGYATAEPGTELIFPRDYGEHSDFRTEWWYLTGNLKGLEGERFGYEVTIFRTALKPDSSADASRANKWSSNQLYMGHIALTAPDAGEKPFMYAERFSRGGLSLAGADSFPFRVWLEEWELRSKGDELFPLMVSAGTDEFSLELMLDSEKPLVLQGNEGYDQKGPQTGNASYYYSFTRLNTTGVIRLGSGSIDVSGTSWKDHEWSTSALGSGQVGWDWFSLQLSNNREIMYYGLRDSTGVWGEFSNGVLVGPFGEKSDLIKDEVTVVPTEFWKSPHSGASYPSGWRFSIPTRDIELTITPLLKDQEMNVSVRYWEGAVAIEGIFEGDTIDGRGYVELTGY